MVLQVCMVQAAVLGMLLVEDEALELPDLEDHPGNPPHSVPAAQASVEAEETVPCSVRCLPLMPNTSGCGEETAGTESIPVVFLDSGTLLWS